MPLGNTSTRYGAVAKWFHWLTALLIFTNIPLGWVAITLAETVRDPASNATQAEIARAALLFSVHKTLGVTIFFVALARILWALSQPKPGLLNGDRPAEAWAAETAHWLLYGSLVAVPLSGWVDHAATTGFAPIWWPFGQSLPFVPKSEVWAARAATVHFVLQWVLTVTIVAHVAGALKHHLLDGDATLRRMLPGDTEARPTARQPGHALPLLSALAVWAVALGGAGALGWFAPHQPPGQGQTSTAALAPVESDWRVQDGALEIAITQLGSRVTGHFADWTAKINYSETPDAEGRHGAVTVTVSIPSLTLGSVTAQAMGPDYFDAATYPAATFQADILSTDSADGSGHVARGTLTIKGRSVPVEMPFSLTLEGDTARATGALTVDRRDFGIGTGVQDPGTLGFEVEISFELVARRG